MRRVVDDRITDGSLNFRDAFDFRHQKLGEVDLNCLELKDNSWAALLDALENIYRRQRKPKTDQKEESESGGVEVAWPSASIGRVFYHSSVPSACHHNRSAERLQILTRNTVRRRECEVNEADEARQTSESKYGGDAAVSISILSARVLQHLCSPPTHFVCVKEIEGTSK